MISYFFQMTLIFYVICRNRGSKDKMIFLEKESTEILKILDLINNIEKYQKLWQKKTYGKTFD